MESRFWGQYNLSCNYQIHLYTYVEMRKLQIKFTLILYLRSQIIVRTVTGNI